MTENCGQLSKIKYLCELLGSTKKVIEMIKFKRLILFLLIFVLYISLIRLKNRINLENEERKLRLEISNISRPIYKIIIEGNEKETNFVTIVTMYYKFRSKHSFNEYSQWTKTFFHSVSSPVVIFTDPEGYDEFKIITDSLRSNVTYYITDNVWHVIKDIERWRGIEFTENYLTKQKKLDPEDYIHGPNLYAAWNSKHFMTKLIAEKNPYNSEFFIYTDIGAWRSEVLKGWPNIEFVRNISKLLNNRALYGQTENVEKIYDIRFDGIEGTFFAGSKTAIANIAEAFYEIHDSWLKKGEFVGKDQHIMNELAYRKYPHLIKRLMIWRRECTKFYNLWFFYQNYFSYPENYSCDPDKFSLIE